MKTLNKPLKVLLFLCLAGLSLQLQAAITVDGFTVNERDATGTFVINRGGDDGPNPLYIDWTTMDGTGNPPAVQPANQPGDYTTASSTNQPIYKYSTINVPVTINQDLTPEPVEDLKLSVTPNAGAYKVDEGAGGNGNPPPWEAQGNIEDDDVEITVTIDVQGGGATQARTRLTCNYGTVQGDDANNGPPDSTNTLLANTSGEATFDVTDIPASPALECVGSMDPEEIPDGYYLTVPANCNDLVADEVCILILAPTRTTFAVNKRYSDRSMQPTNVEIDCNTGFIPDFQKVIVPDNTFDWEVKWIIKDFDTGELDCTVSEQIPTGYVPSYYDAILNTADLTSWGQSTSDEDGCHFTNMVGGEETRCNIWNTLQRVEVEVTKQWFDEHPEFNNSRYTRLNWECTNVRTEQQRFIPPLNDTLYGHPGLYTADGYLHFVDSDFDPDNIDDKSFYVLPNWDTSEGNQTICTITERIKDSSVVSDDEDCEAVKLAPGVDGECTIINTRIYEGIPTLSQYGLALMALLMLGVGLIGYRRMV